MKKLLACILALCLMAGLAACGRPSDDEIRAVRKLSFEGPRLTVTLGTNESTGYQWDYEVFGECVAPSTQRVFTITGSQGDATGEMSIGFEGTGEGSAVIVFTTPNGWDGAGDGDGYTVNVAVGADGTIEKANGMDGAFPVKAAAPVTAAEPAETPEPTATPAPEPKTTLAVSDLAEGTYTGTLSGCSFSSSENESTYMINQSISPAELTVTIQSGQIELYCSASAIAVGSILGAEAPNSPTYMQIASGTLSLSQIDKKTVAAQGDISSSGGSPYIYWDKDYRFSRWEIVPEDEVTYSCTVSIALSEGAPMAEISIDGTASHRTATVPLKLKGEASDQLLSAPYAKLLRSGDYRYTYPLTYENRPYKATIATYNGMICRKVVSDDEKYSMRVVTINGNAWTVDDLTGAVVDNGAEGAETLPDYGATLSFIQSNTLNTGEIADEYQFENAGQQCKLTFLFTPEGELSKLIVFLDNKSSEMKILDFSAAGNDRSLFDAPT